MNRPNIPVKYKDFANFLNDVYLDVYGWLPASRIQRSIAHDLQSALHADEPDTILQAYRGCGKSSILQVFTVWLLMMNPMLNILVTSETANLATKFVEQVRRIIDLMPICQWLIPDNDQIDQATRFYVSANRVSKDPSVEARSTTSQITGFRANYIFPDDNETANNSTTHVQRSKVEKVFDEFAAILKPGGKVIGLGTPHSEDTVYNKLEQKGYRIICYPAQYMSIEDVEKYNGRVAQLYIDAITRNPDLAGKAADPERLDDEELSKRRMRMGAAGFALQYNLDTTLSDVEKYPLKLKDLIVMDCDRTYAPTRITWSNAQNNKLRELQSVGMGGDAYYLPGMVSDKDVMEYTQTVMFIDPSGMGKDETALVILKSLAGKLFVMKVAGFTEGYTDATLTRIASLAKEYGVNVIITEKNYGGGMFSTLLKTAVHKIHPCMIEDTTASNRINKERRILDVLEPAMQQHRIVVDTQVVQDDLDLISKAARENSKEPMQYSLFYQMTRMAAMRGCLAHDDRIDALAGAVAYFTDAMNIDDEESLKAQREEQEWQDHVETMRELGIDITGGDGRNWLG